MIRQYPIQATTSLTGEQVIQTRVLEAGSGDDVVLCVHGLGSRADRFAPALEPLAAAGYHAFAIDLPGHGLADKTPLPLSVPFYGEFVADIARQLRRGRLTVAGTSLGGNVAGYMTRLDHGRPDRLALIGTLGIVPLTEQVRLNISRVALRKRALADTVRKLEALLFDRTLVTSELAEEETRINASRGADETFARLGRYFEEAINDDLVVDDLRSRLGEVQMGFMWGDRDGLVTVETARRCMEVLPELPMVWLRDAGHAPYYERPRAFVNGLQRLFDVVASSAREVTL